MLEEQAEPRTKTETRGQPSPSEVKERSIPCRAKDKIFWATEAHLFLLYVTNNTYTGLKSENRSEEA